MSSSPAFRLLMANGCSTWVRKPTFDNMNKIYYFLVEKSEGKKIVPSFTYAALSKATGINPHQVQFACQKLAFKLNNPLIKIFTFASDNSSKLRLYEKVILISRLKKGSMEDDV